MSTAAGIAAWEEQAAERLIHAGSYQERLRIYGEIYNQDNAFWLRQHGRTGASGPCARNASLLRALCPGSGPVLDIGGGIGVAGDAFPSDRTYVVCDVSSVATFHEQANRSGKRHWVVGYGTELPFASRSFQGVLALDVLEHLHREDIEKLLREAHRVLRPGGRLVIATPNRLTGPWDARCHLRHPRRRKGLHLNELSVSDMLALVKRAGFAPVGFFMKSEGGAVKLRSSRLWARLAEFVLRALPRRYRVRFGPLAAVVAQLPGVE